jgi:hypothetical protein
MWLIIVWLDPLVLEPNEYQTSIFFVWRDNTCTYNVLRIFMWLNFFSLKALF